MMQKAKELDIKPVNDGQLNYVVIDSSMGKLSIAATTHGIEALVFGEADLSSRAKVMKLTPVKGSTPLLDNCVKQLNEYFAGERRAFSLPLHLVGTDFQYNWLNMNK